MSNCGTCGYRCTAHAGANSYPTSCTGGVCQFVCRPNYYDRNGDVMSGSAGNGCEAYCVLSNGGVEKCGDGIDNDCDGQIDEGFDINTDVDNCGVCGYSCAANAAPNQDVVACVARVCQYTCKPNYYDYSALAPGCEYYCVQTNGGTEICDNADNDCDGVIDDGFDKQTNVSHCGACDNACASKVVPNATVTGCVGGVCQFACNEHYYDLNGDLNSASTNGCEYFCNPTAPGAEVCDGEDNDCDGQKDKDAGGSPLTRACYSPGYGASTGCTAPGSCIGTCREGQQTCKGVVGDLWNPCLGDLAPATAEVCDNRDDDCDGQVDEDFDKQTDINHCGACGASCWASRPAHAYPTGCVAAKCQYTCEPGYADLNGDLNSPGGTCEYQCPVYPTSAETCDGIDNDCDGIIDEDLVVPPLGFCFQGIDGAVGTPGTETNNPCKGTAPQCIDPDGVGGLPKGWYCNWQAAVEVDPTNRNRILGYELRCNGLDGDCDGRPDDAWPLKGTGCKDDGIGECQGSGTMVCDATGTDITCQVTTPGALPGTEECNGLDDDCDGVVDNDTPGHMMPVTIGATTYWVDVYEASRPDATELGAGRISDRACSEPGRIPWANVSWDEADAACAAQGKRLCEEEEWQEACEGPAMLLYPYGNTYQKQYCNGNDYDPNCAGPDDDWALATGTAIGCPAPPSTRCISPYGIVDLSGNVMEWTSTLVGTGSYRVRGGAFDNSKAGLTCDFDFISLEPSFRYSTLGFRCCSDTDLTP
jgi:hypothetical protein